MLNPVPNPSLATTPYSYKSSFKTILLQTWQKSYHIRETHILPFIPFFLFRWRIVSRTTDCHYSTQIGMTVLNVQFQSHATMTHDSEHYMNYPKFLRYICSPLLGHLSLETNQKYIPFREPRLANVQMPELFPTDSRPFSKWVSWSMRFL